MMCLTYTDFIFSYLNAASTLHSTGLMLFRKTTAYSEKHTTFTKYLNTSRHCRTTKHWNLIGCSMTSSPPTSSPSPLYYFPVVFFRLLHLIAISFPTRKNSVRVFEMLFQLFRYFLKIALSFGIA